MWEMGLFDVDISASSLKSKQHSNYFSRKQTIIRRPAQPEPNSILLCVSLSTPVNSSAEKDSITEKWKTESHDSNFKDCPEI